MHYLKKYWHKYGAVFLVGILCVLLEAVCDLFQPRIMSLLVDKGALTGSLPNVWRYGFMMLGVALLGMCFSLSRNYFACRVSQAFAADLRLDLFVKIQSLSCDGIDNFTEGSLITRATNDVTQLQNFCSSMMRMAVKAPFTCLGAIVMAASLSLNTISLIIPIVIAVIAVIILSMRLAYPRFDQMQNALDRLNTSVREYLAGIRLVKAFRQFRGEQKRFDQANQGLSNATVEANHVLALCSPFLSFFVNLGVAAILWFGSLWVDYGDMEVGQVMAFITYMANMLTSLSLISNTMNIFVRVKASHHRIVEVFQAEPDPPAPSGAEHDNSQPVVGTPHIELRNVSFRYCGSTGQPALQEISFALQKGEKLGIIGPTGSGKTTLASLLMRFYEPQKGEIAVNGVPLAEFDEAQWRTRAAIVPQAPALFTGTIRENILWGKEDASEEEIERAARDAQAYEFIQTSAEGFDRPIGQGGTGLSGGQKQRVSITRALIRQPELLVLDDCTSALDTVTEAAVRDALAQYSMTTILITQRVATAQSCDKILVLENGTMAGFGTHEELTRTCPLYRDICRSQIGGDDIGCSA